MNGSPSNGMNTSAIMSPPSLLSMNMNQSIRVHSPATATPAMRGAPKEVAFRPKGAYLNERFHSLKSKNPNQNAFLLFVLPF